MHNTLSTFLQTLLHKHSCVILPGFGGFVTNYKSATIDPHTDFFSPPSLNIAFNQALTHNDGLLMQEIAKNEHKTLDQAEEELAKKINRLKKELYSEGRVEIEGIGLLYLDSDYKIQFKAALKANLLPQSYGLRSFRFASLRSRKQTQTFEKLYMEGTVSNKKIIVTSIAAASVVIFLTVTFFINNKLNQNQEFEASVLSLGDTAQQITEPQDHAEKKDDETSTKKTLALQYTESYNSVEYHIIAASYTNMQSAKKFAKQLTEEGYTPMFITDGDKIRISIFSYEDRYEALKQLDFLRVTKDKTVWLLKKHTN